MAHSTVCESSRRVIKFSGEKAQPAILVVVVVDAATPELAFDAIQGTHAEGGDAR